MPQHVYPQGPVTCAPTSRGVCLALCISLCPAQVKVTPTCWAVHTDTLTYTHSHTYTDTHVLGVYVPDLELPALIFSQRVVGFNELFNKLKMFVISPKFLLLCLDIILCIYVLQASVNLHLQSKRICDYN